MPNVLTRNNAPKATQRVADLYAPAPLGFSDLDASPAQLDADTKPKSPAQYTQEQFIAVLEANRPAKTNKAKIIVKESSTMNKPVTTQPISETAQVFTNTSAAYLRAALAKASDPAHPNFTKNMTPTRLAEENASRLLCARAYDTLPEHPSAADVKEAFMLAARSVTQSLGADAFMRMCKSLASNAAYQASFDIRELKGRISTNDLDLGEGPTLDVADIPVADLGAFDRTAAREKYEGGERPQPLATSVEDLLAGIEGLQLFLMIPFAKMRANDPDRAEFHGVHGSHFPLAFRQVPDVTRKGGVRYVPITDFDEYCTHSFEVWKAKQNAVVVLDDDIEAQMRAA